MANKKTRYEIIRTYTEPDFKKKVQKYCADVKKSESRVVKEALNKLMEGKK